MKHFISILLGSIIVKLKVDFNTLMIIVYIKNLFIMPSSTSDNLRLKQPCATIIERLDKEKVTFGVLNSCGRITDACFENAYICRKKYPCG